MNDDRTPIQGKATSQRSRQQPSGKTSRNDCTQFICLKWGDKYPAEYVNRLYRMVCRHFHGALRFYCLTEQPAGLASEIETLPLETSGLHGFWYKLSLFQRDFFGLQGQVIYLDLDLVIVDAIDFLAEHPGEFVVLRNWSRNPMWNSSVMRFTIGQHAAIWDGFVERSIEIMARLPGDQEWIYRCVPNASTWPETRILSYKKSLDSRAYSWLPRSWVKVSRLRASSRDDTRLPAEAAIVVFHGDPKPGDVAQGICGIWKRASFVNEHWR